MPPTKTWKSKERQIAKYFGCLRQRLSGSSGRDDETASDSTHATLFLEVKYRAKHATRELHDATRKKADKEGKLPVVCLASKGKAGFLVCFHSDDLETVLAEILASKYPPDPLPDDD